MESIDMLMRQERLHNSPGATATLVHVQPPNIWAAASFPPEFVSIGSNNLIKTGKKKKRIIHKEENQQNSHKSVFRQKPEV